MKPGKKINKFKIKTILIIAWATILIPLLVFACYRAVYFYHPTIPESALSIFYKDGTELLNDVDLYRNESNSHTFRIPVEDFDILENTINVRIKSSDIKGNLTISFVENDGEIWQAPHEKFGNGKISKEYSMEDYIFVNNGFGWRYGLQNITNISFRVDVEEILGNPRIYLDYLRIQNSTKKKSLIILPVFDLTPKYYRNTYMQNKKEGTYRIVALGDSMLQGAGKEVQLKNEEVFTALLEKILNNRKSGKNFEILNFGVGGYDTEQEVEFYESEASKYSPDAVMIFIYRNDWESSKTIQNKMDELGRTEKYQYLYSSLQESQKENARRFLIEAALQEYKAESNLDENEQVQTVIEQLMRLKKDLNETPLIIISFYDTPESWIESLNNLSNSESIPYLNLNYLTENYGPRRIYISPDLQPVDSHPSSFAHQIIAEKLYEFMEQEALLPK